MHRCNHNLEVEVGTCIPNTFSIQGTAPHMTPAFRKRPVGYIDDIILIYKKSLKS